MISPELDHRYSAFKRVGIFLLDGLLILILYISLLFSLGTVLITNIAKDNVQIINEELVRVSTTLDVPLIHHELYDLSQIDMDKIIDEVVGSGKSAEEGFIKYNELNQIVNEELIKSEVYKANFNDFYRTYLIVNILMMFSSLLVLELIIPLFNKKHQTLAMMLFKTCLVNKDSFICLSKYQVLIRFFTIFLLEYLVVYLFMNTAGLIMLVLLSIASISFTKNRASFSELIMKTKMSKIEYSYDE